jgi:hypothetical protein
MYSDSSRQAAYAAIQSGLPDVEVASIAGVPTRSVAAFRAHVTMGHATTSEPVEFKLTKTQIKAISNGHPIVFSAV